MKKNVLLLFVVLLLLPTSVFSQENMEYEFEPFLTLTFNQNVFWKEVFDLNDDGDDDLLQIVNDGTRFSFLAVDINGVFFTQQYLWNVSDNIKNPNFEIADINNDGIFEVVFIYSKQDSFYMEIRDSRDIQNELLKSYTLCPDREEYIDLSLEILKIIDLKKDGSFEAIIRFNDATGKSRKICAVNLDTGSPIWEYPIAGMPASFEIYNERIIIGSDAHSNNWSVNGMSDSRSYLIVLDFEGNEIWREQIGNGYTQVWIQLFDWNGDGKKEIYFIERRGGANNPVKTRKMGIRDINTGEGQNTIYLNNQLLDFAITKNPNSAILLFFKNNKEISVFDRNLNNRKNIPVENSEYINSKVELSDISGNGNEEIIFFSDIQKSIYIWDLNFKTIARKEFKGQPFIFNNKSENQKLIGCFDRGSLPLYRLKKVNLLKKYRTLITGFGGGILLTLFFVIVYISARGSLRIPGIKRKPEIMYSKQEEMEKDKLLRWLSIAQKISHDIKNPLSTMLLSIQRLEKNNMPEDSATHLASMKEEVERLSNISNLFLKISNVDSLKKETVSVKDILEENTGFFKRCTSENINIELNIENSLPLLRADAQHFSLAVRNILENAVDALQGSGRVTVRGFLSEELNGKRIREFVNIEVTDDGGGISPKDLEKIFSPGFTTKTGGTGFGMVIAKEIVETYGGSINIHSKSGIGTIVTIKIPVE